MDNPPRYIIIILLIAIIVAYCIFAYPYVYNKVDMIQYKMAHKSPFIEFDETDIKYFEDAKKLILRTFSNFKDFVEKTKDQIDNTSQFIVKLKHDFII
jgi:hypothetical protein